MYRFNLNNVSKHNLEIVEEYLNKQSTSWESIDQFASISLANDFENNTNNEHLLEKIELSILHFDIFCKNKKVLSKLSYEYDGEKEIIDYLKDSIEDEKKTRFKRKLEDILNKSDKRLNKDLDLIDKKTKI